MLDDDRRTAAVAEEAWNRIKAIGLPPDPTVYEVWFNYVAGTNAAVNDDINALLESGTLSRDSLQDIYERHVSPIRYFERLAVSGENLRDKVDMVAELVDVAYGSTTGYSAELLDASRRLDQAYDCQSVRSIVAGLIRSTEEIQETNKRLQEQLSDSETQLARLRDSIETLHIESMKDPLTAVANRKSFEISLGRMVEQAERTGKPLSLVFVDVDFFANFNNQFGHRVGDAVLRIVGSIIQNTIRGADSVARYGGDEFVVLLPRTTHDDALLVGENIRRAVVEKDLIRRSTNESLGRLSLSVGVAEHEIGQPPHALVERADRNLLAAKRGGRDRVMGRAD